MLTGSFGHFIKIVSGAGWLMKRMTSLQRPWLLKSQNLTPRTGRWNIDTRKMADSANSISCKQTCHHTADTAESAVYLTLIYRLFGEAGRTTSAGVAICCAIFVGSISGIIPG
jgi:hypothetical protein